MHLQTCGVCIAFFGHLCMNKGKHRFSSSLRWGGVKFVEAPVTIMLAQVVAIGCIGEVPASIIL
jgi:hypothetical protein